MSKKFLGVLFSGGLHEWATRAVRAVRRSPSFHAASSLGFHNFKMAAFQSDAKDVVEVHKKDDTTGKMLAALDRVRQNCTPEEFRLNIFQIDDVEDLVRAGFRTREDKLIEFLRTSKYQYGVSLMTATSSVPGKPGSVNVSSMLQQRWKICFCNSDLSPTTVNGGPRRFCVRKLASFG